MEGIKTVSEKFIALEKQFEVYKHKIDGTEWWFLVRLDIFIEVCVRSGIHSRPQDSSTISFSQLRSSIFFIIKSIKNLFYSFEIKKYLFYGHPRRKLLSDKKWWDIYCDLIIDNLSDDYLLMERTFKGKHFLPAKTHNIYYNDIFHFRNRLIVKYSKYNFSKDEIIYIYNISAELENKFNVRIDILRLVSVKLLLRKYEVPYFTKILKRVNPELIFVVVWYSSTSIIEAAKKLSIPVVELQHGTISKYHLGYNFPIKKAFSNSLPDHLFLFGQFWIQDINFPIDSDNMRIVGYPYYEHSLIQHYNKDKTVEGRILFISQGSIGRHLSRFAVEFSKLANGKYEIIIKLHPGENVDWIAKYPWLNIDDIKVAESSENLYELINSSTYVVGVYSTAIYEAISFNKKIFLIGVAGIEYMSYLLETGLATRVDYPVDLLHLLSIPDSSSNKTQTDFIFERDWKSKFDFHINDILVGS